MALDEYLMLRATSPDIAPVLRLFDWSPPCLSLGFAQSYSDVDNAALESRGWTLVRRPTGGRAILHIDEITYSVSAHQNHPMMWGGVLESYQRIASFLLHSLQRFGLSPQSVAQPAQSSGSPNPICFEVPSNYEITVNGRKIIGSAQARRNQAVLQHGSLPLHGDLTRIISGLQQTSQVSAREASTQLMHHATTLEQELGRKVAWTEAADHLTSAFKDLMGTNPKPFVLTPEDSAAVEHIRSSKYASDTWTKRF